MTLEDLVFNLIMGFAVKDRVSRPEERVPTGPSRVG